VTDVVDIHLTGPVRDELRSAAAAAAPKETGGLLLGWWDGPRVIVRHAVEVPDRRATRESWTRRPRVARRVLRQALDEFDHPLLGYVGDWHSHPSVCAASSRDLDSIAETSKQYDRALVLLVPLPDGSVDVRAAQSGRRRAARLNAGEAA
jgi:proteasome lid subunit RPN8/RPN11